MIPRIRLPVVTLVLATLLASLSGCPFGSGPLPPADAPAAPLTEGAFDTTLKVDSLNMFTVEVPEGRGLEVIAVPLEEASLGLRFMESPEGRVFRAQPGAALQTRDERLKVFPRSAGADRQGFRFTGSADTAGTWRFSIMARPGALEALQENIERRSVLENFLLGLYFVADRPELPSWAEDLLFEAYPEVPLLPDSVAVAVEVNFTGAEQPGDGGDGGDANEPADANVPAPPTDVQFETIARTGDPVPDQPSATFRYFSNPIIDAEGRVAFYASYEGGSGEAGLYVYEGGSVQRVFDTDPTRTGAVPGRPDSDTFGGFTVEWDAGSPTMTWGSEGRLVFAAHLSGSGLPNAILRWRASDEDLLLVSDDAQTRALFADATENFLPELFHPGLSDAGQVFFGGRFSFFRQNGEFSLFNVGVFRTNAQQATPIVSPSLDPPAVPGQPDGAQFTGVELLTAVNAEGDVLLQGSYRDGQGDHGIYLWRSGGLVLVLDNAPNRSFPGLPEGIQIGSTGAAFDAMALGDGGQIAVETTLRNLGGADEVVLYWDGQQWTQVRGSQNRTAGVLLSGVNRRGRLLFRSDGDPHLGDQQSAVNLAERLPPALASVGVTFPTVAGAVSNANRALIRYQRPNGAAGLLLWTGEQLLRVVDLDSGIPEAGFDTLFPPERVEVTDRLDRAGTIVGRPEVDRPGQSGMLNDRDQFTLRLGSLGADGEPNTQDDEQAIVIGRGR